MKTRITENLDVDLSTQRWHCHHCEGDLGSALSNYKEGCLVAARDPKDIWQPLVDEEISFTYDSRWCRIVEFYCPSCAWLIELEVLPPGHPITHDIQIDLDALLVRANAERGEA